MDSAAEKTASCVLRGIDPGMTGWTGDSNEVSGDNGHLAQALRANLVGHHRRESEFGLNHVTLRSPILRPD